MTRHDRVLGSLLGGAVGDALGAPVEFSSLRDIREDHGPGGVTGYVPDWRGALGLITDDTQMTLFTVEGLLRGGDVQAVRQAYLRWLDTQDHRTPRPPTVPIGSATCVRKSGCTPGGHRATPACPGCTGPFPGLPPSVPPGR